MSVCDELTSFTWNQLRHLYNEYIRDLAEAKLPEKELLFAVRTLVLIWDETRHRLKEEAHEAWDIYDDISLWDSLGNEEDHNIET